MGIISAKEAWEKLDKYIGNEDYWDGCINNLINKAILNGEHHVNFILPKKIRGKYFEKLKNLGYDPQYSLFCYDVGDDIIIYF